MLNINIVAENRPNSWKGNEKNGEIEKQKQFSAKERTMHVSVDSNKNCLEDPRWFKTRIKMFRIVKSGLRRYCECRVTIYISDTYIVDQEDERR